MNKPAPTDQALVKIDALHYQSHLLKDGAWSPAAVFELRDEPTDPAFPVMGFRGPVVDILTLYPVVEESASAEVSE